MPEPDTVTSTQQAEETQLQNEHFRQMFTAHSAVQLLIDPCSGAIVQANPAAACFYGYPVEILQTMNIKQINMLSGEQIQSEMHAAHQRDQNYFIFPHRLASGKICDVEVYSTPIRLGERTLLYSIIHDITARRQAEQALAEQKNRLDYIIRGTRTATWEWNVQTGETVFNERWAEIIGYTLEEIFPISIDTWTRFAHPDDLKISGEMLARHFKGELDYYECEARMRHKNGEWVWVLDRGQVVQWMEDGRPLLMCGTHQDITGRKRAEMALRQSENNFATFFDNVDDLLFVLDAEGNIIQANTTACKRLQYSEEELIGMHVLQVHPPDRREETAQVVMEMLAGKRRECRIPVMDRHGNLIEVETYITRGKWNGQDALFGVTKDLSALKRSEEKFAKAFHMNSSLMAISTLDEGVYVDVNDAFCATLGYTREEVIGKTSIQLWLFEDAHQRQHMLNEFRRQGRLKNLEFKIHARDGSLREGLFSAEQIEINGKPHLLSMFFDVTMLKQMEQELRTQRDFATQIINLMGQGLTVTDAEGRFKFVNPAYARLFGYETADLIGKFPSDVTIPEDRAALVEQRKYRQAGKSTTYESRLRRADGSIAPVLITAVPHYHDGLYNGAIAVITDLTEQKRVEERITTLLHEKELLLREVHHRIKNNMSTITSLLHLQAGNQTDPSVKMALQDAAARVQSMMVLYDKLYRSENFGEVALQEYIPSLLHEIIHLFPNQDSIRIQTQIDPISILPKLLSPIGIILNELVTNAMKYAFVERKEGVIKVTAVQQLKRVSITFEDDGVGLSESFSMENSPGFGMQLVSILVQQIRGSLTIENGQGTRFIIAFDIT